MARYKTYDYRQRVLLPVSLEDQLMPGTSEFAIHTPVEKRLDMAIFHGNEYLDHYILGAKAISILFYLA
jgi:hypothetical protein